MTFKINKSQVPANFAEQVELYRQAMLAHRFTLERPAPVAPSQDVEFAVKRVQYPIKDKKPDDFVVDFEIINDDPPPPTFEQKKQKLFAALHVAEHKAQAAICPPGKARLFAMQAGEVMAKGEKDRTPEDEKILAAHNDRQSRLNKISRMAAEQEAEIEDLTEETIDGWELKPLE